MSKNFKIAILGAGYMAEEYLKVLQKEIFFVKQFIQEHYQNVKSLKKSIKLKKFQKFK